MMQGLSFRKKMGKNTQVKIDKIHIVHKAMLQIQLKIEALC